MAYRAIYSQRVEESGMSAKERDAIEALKRIAHGCGRTRQLGKDYTVRLTAIEAQQAARAVLVKHNIPWSPDGEKAAQLERAS